jgi:hypothetical protein
VNAPSRAYGPVSGTAAGVAGGGGGVRVDLCPECDDQPHRTRHAQVPGQQTIDDLLADDENEEACDVVELR